MDHKLKQDLDWFFEVYDNRVNDELRHSTTVNAVRSMLTEELELLHDSVIARLEKYFRTGA